MSIWFLQVLLGEPLFTDLEHKGSHNLIPWRPKVLFWKFAYRRKTEFGQGYVTESGPPMWEAEADTELT